MNRLRLGVNIDHVATLRQARYPGAEAPARAEPDVLAAAAACERAGADAVTIHLREDRRHMQERDVEALCAWRRLRLNLELANDTGVVDIALRLRPDDACLVPERRREVTTEGGLDAAGHREELRPTVARLREAGVVVSLFIGPDPMQVDAARDLGADAVELHTGAFADAFGTGAESAELGRLDAAARRAHGAGLIVNAGHGINYENIGAILTLPHLHELNIGHTIVSRAVFVGLEEAIRQMRARMAAYDAGGEEPR